jgi:tetratricopeptide (TPR) repeat protein
MTVTIGRSYSSWAFTTSKNTNITSIKAWELESGTSIDIEESDEGDRIEYLLDFQGTKGKGFQFVIEREQKDSVEEKYDRTYYLYWGWTSSLNSIHTATVLLPKKHELLYSNYIQPEEVTSRLEQLTVHLNQELPEESTFRIGLMFSKKGALLLKRAKSAFRLNQWSDAKEAYEDAIEFYEQFSELYDKNKTEFILDLKHNVSECEEHLEEERIERNTQIAEEKHAEGLSAFEQEDYESAKLLFTQAQNMYKSVGYTEMAEECQEYIDQCITKLEEVDLKSEADALFDEAVTYMDQGQYEQAKTTFQEALLKYEELGDQSRAEECTQNIALCDAEMKDEGEEQDGGTCTGTILLVLLCIGGVGTGYRKRA